MGGVAWSEEEDHLLRKCVQQYGEGKWHRIPLLAGINRCRKSCRLRWLNYLRPNIKRGRFMDDEVELIIKLHNILGNKWSLIAARLPGRTANDVKNYWNCHLKKKLNNNNNNISQHVESIETTQNTLEVSKPWEQGQCKDTEASVSGTQMARDQHVTTTSSKEMVPLLQDESYNDHTILNQKDDNKFSLIEEEHRVMEEFPLSIDFDLEEIKIAVGEQSKCNWDFDDLMFDMEL